MHWRASLLVPGLLAAALAGGATAAHAGSEPPGPPATTGSEPPTDPAAFDVEIVCHELEIGLPDSYRSPEQIPGFDDPELHRLTAVAVLATAAGLADTAYEAFGEAGDTIFDAWTRLQVDALDDALAALRDQCAVLGDASGTGSAATALTATEYDVHALCLLVDGLPEQLAFPDDFPGFDDPLSWRLQGIASLGQAAALGDDAHQAVGHAAEELERSRNTFDAEGFAKALDGLRHGCASADGGTAPAGA